MSSQPSAGYSGTPLPKKLGLKTGHRVAFPGAPPDFAATLGDLPEGIEILQEGATNLDLVVSFVSSAAELRDGLARWAGSIAPAGMLWIAWPKKASGIRTDLTEDVVRRAALDQGLVDTKVAAIDATWSGLKLVYRLKDRPQAAQGSSLLTRGTDETPGLSPEELAELEAGIAEANRGDLISGEELFKQLRRHG